MQKVPQVRSTQSAGNRLSDHEAIWRQRDASKSKIPPFNATGRALFRTLILDVSRSCLHGKLWDEQGNPKHDANCKARTAARLNC